MLMKYGMQNCKAVDTPSVPEDDGHEDKEQVTFPYREAVGSLLYLSTRTRPDIAYAVGAASRNMESPERKHVTALKRIFKYLAGTLGEGVCYKFAANVLKSYSDADYAGDVKTRRSTSGYVITFGDGPVSWASRRQPIVALSSTEAEYIAAAECCKETMFIKSMMREFKLDVPVIFKIDNQSAIQLVKTGIFNKRTKHIDVRYHYIHELYSTGHLAIEYCPTNMQTADIFTKPLGKTKFLSHKKNLLC